MSRWLAVAVTLGLAACASNPHKSASQPQPLPGGGDVSGAPLPGERKVSPYAPAQEDPRKRGHYTAGGLYAPHIADSTPTDIPDVDRIPEPEVTNEPRSAVGNRPSYSVLGRRYNVLESARGYVEQGNASYYGNKFHGRRTSNLEVYDMYAFTAAHKTLPLPSFARVTNLDNGTSVVVRVNDRGPFHEGRIIDLSYAAAIKLGITQRGTGRVEVRALTPGDQAPVFASAANNPPQPARPASPPPAPAPTALDKLVAAMPIAGARAATPEPRAAASTTAVTASAPLLPPGVRIATGRPTRLDGNPASPPGAAAPGAAGVGATTASASSPTVATNTATAAPAGGGAPDWRFDMRQDGRTMTADEFEAWMKSRQVRVATGKPAAGQGTAPPAVATAPASATPADAVRVPVGGDAVTLQVASFSARGNADRALAMLHGAGIDDARLLDGQANGQKVWRLRVGPLAATAAPQTAARIVGLGFGPPQRVRE